MTRIVVGVDASPYAERALQWALRERDWHGGSVTAVLAWTYLGQFHAAEDGKFDPEYEAADAAAALATIVERVAPGDAAIEQVVVNDLPARALLEQSADADLLVVGARGVGRIRGALLGSVSQQCALHATVPIAIIRDDDDGNAGGDRPERVLVGVDGSDTSQRALVWAAAEAQARDAILTVVHAWQPFVVAFDAMPVVTDVDFEGEGRRLVAEQLAAASLDGFADDRLEVIVVPDSPAAAVLDAAEDATLLVVGSRGRGGFASLLLGSVSQHVIQNAPCPVVVIPPEGKTRQVD